MTIARRSLLIGAAVLLARPFSGADRAEAATHDILMTGNADGSRVSFDPVGLLVRPGDTLRWINRDRGNSHTATAYHPANDGHPLRIPAGAAPWNSDYLLPDESFEVTLTVPGVYDYFCIPHEHAGMVGRIVVLDEGAALPAAVAGSPIDDLAEDPFPSVAEIVRSGRVGQR